jgi:hypothetical protein
VLTRILIFTLLLAPALSGAEAPEAVTEESASFQNVLVRPGDTLWGISHAYLKDPARWDEILKANRLPTNDPTVALPGMTLRVPVRLIKTSLRAAHVVVLVNKVQVRSKETPDWKSSKLGMDIFGGDSLRTREDSRASILFINRQRLNLEQNSMVVLRPPDQEVDVELKTGAVFAGPTRVMASTALITPSTKDARFSATVDSNLKTHVEVFKGAAAVSAQGASVTVQAGMETSVTPGLTPETPQPLRDPGGLETLSREFDRDGEGAAAASPAAAPAPAPEPAAVKLNGDLQTLKAGEPIQGYRVQASVERDFSKVVFDKVINADERFSPDDAGLNPGAYWWRVAIIDLLGAEGRFREPRYYSVGLKSAKP